MLMDMAEYRCVYFSLSTKRNLFSFLQNIYQDNNYIVDFFNPLSLLNCFEGFHCEGHDSIWLCVLKSC